MFIFGWLQNRTKLTKGLLEQDSDSPLFVFRNGVIIKRDGQGHSYGAAGGEVLGLVHE